MHAESLTEAIAGAEIGVAVSQDDRDEHVVTAATVQFVVLHDLDLSAIAEVSYGGVVDRGVGLVPDAPPNCTTTPSPTYRAWWW